MKKITLFLLLILVKLSGFAQTNAESLPLPNGASLTGLAFVDSSLGFACGFNGRILKTTNAGNLWTELSTGTNDQINGIACQDAQNVFACTQTGKLLQTSNSGQNWLVSSISTSPLSKIHFHHGVLFVLSENGMLHLNPHLDIGNLSLSIGGSWANLDQMFWINSQLGFVVADSTHAFAGKSCLYRTTNGGYNWSRVQNIQSTEGNWRTDTLYRNFSWKNLHHIIQLPDSSLLMSGGYYPGYVWKSTDLGQTFHIIADMTQCNPIQIESFGPGKVALISWEGDALFPYIARNRNGALLWPEWINDTSLFQLPDPFRPWGKATFFGPKLGFIPGHNQNINGSLTGAILRVRNVFPDVVTRLPEELKDDEVRLFPNPASKEVYLKGAQADHEISLYSAQGQKLQAQMKVKDHGVWVDVSLFPPGFYSLRWKGGFKRFLKE